MLIGVPKEIKNHEYRVGMTPESVAEATRHGHQVIVETNAGNGIGASDEAYQAAGATMCASAQEVFDRADMIVKVKEPQAVERKMLKPDQLLFTYLHLAPDPDQTRDLVESGATCIAYETITSNSGALPLLKPMSQVAGRMSIQAGAAALEKSKGGKGLLLGGVPGVAPANVVVLGGGVVGFNAAQMAVGLQANVTILDKNPATLEALSNHFGSTAKTLYSTQATLEHAVLNADLVIGAVLIPGAAAPKLVTREMIRNMEAGSVLVDVAIDQGGCFETSKPTTHADPTYIVDDVIHYCVANMPGGVAKTSTYALNNATLPFILALADKGWQQALKDDPHLLNGLNVWQGKVTNQPVAEALNYTFVSPQSALGNI
jgi:alanine dehydrogenase